MFWKTWMAVTAIVTMPAGLKAEEPKPDQPYSARVGDKLITSVTREATKGPGPNRDELLKAARESIPLNVVPAKPPSQVKPR
jgi:hypothetical protein